MTGAGVWAAVCVKSLGSAKQRLAPALSPGMRRGLVLAMLREVLAALADTPGLGGVMVVTPDSDVLALTAELGIKGIAQDGDIGFAASANQAALAVAGLGRATGLMVVPADVPLATPGDFAAVLAARTGPGCSIVPSWDGRGSNCVLVSPPGAMGFHFGADSCRRHLAAAAAAGLGTRCVANARLGLDIDTPADFARLADAVCGPHIRAFLAAMRPTVQGLACNVVGAGP